MKDYQEMRKRAGIAEYDVKRLSGILARLLILQFGFTLKEAERITKDEMLLSFFKEHIDRIATKDAPNIVNVIFERPETDVDIDEIVSKINERMRESLKANSPLY